MMSNDKFAGLEMANERICFHTMAHAGRAEVSGPKSNPWILMLLRQYNDGAFSWARDDGEIAWCSIYMQLVALNACAIIDPKTNAGKTALAKSWLHSGREIQYEKALPGDVAIFTRSGGGHVAPLARIDFPGKVVQVLGGNQSNAVKLSAYRLDRLIGVRRLYIEPSPIEKLV